MELVDKKWARVKCCKILEAISDQQRQGCDVFVEKRLYSKDQ